VVWGEIGARKKKKMVTLLEWSYGRESLGRGKNGAVLWQALVVNIPSMST